MLKFPWLLALKTWGGIGTSLLWDDMHVGCWGKALLVDTLFSCLDLNGYKLTIVDQAERR